MKSIRYFLLFGVILFSVAVMLSCEASPMLSESERLEAEWEAIVIERETPVTDIQVNAGFRDSSPWRTDHSETIEAFLDLFGQLEIENMERRSLENDMLLLKNGMTVHLLPKDPNNASCLYIYLPSSGDIYIRINDDADDIVTLARMKPNTEVKAALEQLIVN